MYCRLTVANFSSSSSSSSCRAKTNFNRKMTRSPYIVSCFALIRHFSRAPESSDH